MKVKFEKFWATKNVEVFVDGVSVGLLVVTKHGWTANKGSPSQSWFFQPDPDSTMGRQISGRMPRVFDRYDYSKDIKQAVKMAVEDIDEVRREIYAEAVANA
jgi:hypothetical protein